MNLANRRERARTYETVLREGRPADIIDIVDGALLVDLWDELVLPVASVTRGSRSSTRCVVAADEIDALLADQGSTVIDINQSSFVGYTAAALSSVALLGLALWLEGTHRRLGLVVGGLAVLVVALVWPLTGDWPPLGTYFLTLALGVGLVRQERPSPSR